MRITWTLMAFLCLLLAGCKGDSPLVGRWKLEPSAEARSSPQGAPTVSLEFKEDGTFSMLLVSEGRSDTLTGQYKLEGKTLTMTPTSEGGKPSSDPPEVITMSEDMKSFPAPGASHMGNMVRE
jgi:uncharacterized protein (TIGR03066 family)